MEHFQAILGEQIAGGRHAGSRALVAGERLDVRRRLGLHSRSAAAALAARAGLI